jgi:hypothetical protein
MPLVLAICRSGSTNSQVGIGDFISVILHVEHSNGLSDKAVE